MEWIFVDKQEWKTNDTDHIKEARTGVQGDGI